MEVKLIPTKDEKDGMFYYIIPEGTKLYRGDTEFYLKLNDNSIKWEDINNKPTFFGILPESVETYGIVYEFITNREYKLLALDDPTTMELLFKKTNPEIQKILNYNYARSGDKTRKSVAKDDFKLSYFLCKNGYDGYGINHMKTEAGGNFHSEVMICDPKSISLNKIVTDDSEQIKRMKHEYNARKKKEEMEMKRKEEKKKMSSFNNGDSDNDKPLSKKTLFGDDDDSTDDYKPLLNKTLFIDESYNSPPKKGGKSNKTNKKNKLNKKRTNKRTNKKMKKHKKQ